MKRLWRAECESESYIGAMTVPRRIPVRKLRLGEEDELADYVALTPSERLAMIWPLTVQAWAFAGRDIRELRLSRSTVRVIRRGR